MSDQGAIINTLIQQVRAIDPSLADVLLKMADEIDRIATKVDPPPTVPKRSTVPAIPPPPGVLTITFELTRTNVILRWVPPTTGFVLYEIRQGTDWDTATRLLSTGNNLVALDPTPIGSTPFLIKTINAVGTYSLEFARVDVVVPPIGTFAVTAQAIGSGVTLAWTIPASAFEINFFTISRGGAIVSAQLRGTFFAFQENAGGKFTYSIVAEDIAGNKSAPVSATLDVAKPEDYDIQTTYVSDFSGTITNGLKRDGVIYYNLNTIQTYQEHFVNAPFYIGTATSPQHQINAGFPLWIQPTLTSGSYDETHDFTVALTNVIIAIDWLYENVVPSFTFGTQIYYRELVTDAWQGPFTAQSVFAPKVRYVRVVFTFSGSDTKALMMFKRFTIALYVKRENDGGQQVIGSTSPTGDVVLFKKPFKFIESITVTPETTTQAYAVYTYTVVPVPVSFNVFMFNNAGTRISGPISWKARGIL